MDTKTLIQKIASKSVLTPFEAIKIQRLNGKYKRKEAAKQIALMDNPYVDVERVSGILSQSQIDRIVSFHTRYEKDEYDSYRWAANELIDLEVLCECEAYRGLSLLLELNNIRSESLGNMLIMQREGKPITGSLFEYIGHSHIHQKAMTFLEVYESFVTSFHAFAQLIDNILTLNYYLNELYSVDELKCLQILKMWFSNRPKTPKEIEAEKLYPEIEEGHACYNILFYLIFDRNHPKFVDYIKQNTSLRPSPNFHEGSLEYVKSVIKKLGLVHIEYLCLGKADWHKELSKPSA